jgi:hypothetical protein
MKYADVETSSFVQLVKAVGDSGEYFTLIGYPTLVFIVVRRFNAAGHIKSVHGRTLDGKRETKAREADVVLTNAQGAPVSREEALKRGEAWADIDIPALVKKETA